MGVGSDLALPALSKSTFPKPAIVREGDTKKTKNQNMKNMMLKLLGLNTLVAEIDRLKEENENLNLALANLKEKVEEMEIPDFDADDFVREDDVNDRIESYLNDNEYCSSSYVDDEIESKVSEKVEEAIEDLDLESKTASSGEQDIEAKVSEAVKVTLERMVKALADQQG